MARPGKAATASDEVIVLSDEDSPTSASPISAPQEGGTADLSQIQQLLEQEESKLKRLKQLRGLQTPVTTATDSEAVKSRSSTKSNIVVVPGNQKSITTSAGGTGISSRLQHIVDSIAVDQAFPPSHKSGAALKSQAGGRSMTHLSQASKPVSEVTSDSVTLTSKAPPPLLPTPASTAAAGKTSVPVTSDPGPPSLKPVDPEREKTVMAAVENSRRYKEYLSKNQVAKKTFQKQIERKIASAPYPKTFRQVWPIIPVFDSSFIRNYGLEAIMQHFDSSLASSAAQEKVNSSSKVKPICNQCGCDFASAWQIRKSNSKQLLLCEACDFANLKILQRSKLANQLRDLLASISKEKEQFETECEEARKQVVSSERQLVQAMMAQSHNLPSLYPSSQKSSVAASSARVQSSQGPRGKVPSGVAVVSSTQAVIPSILPSLSSSRETPNGSRKRKEAGAVVVAPAGKSLKLDQTLDKLSKALLERKLDEQRQQVGGKGEGIAGSADSRKSKRKGTPRHKRHLSSSSPNSP